MKGEEIGGREEGRGGENEHNAVLQQLPAQRSVLSCVHKTYICMYVHKQGCSEM